MSTPTHPVAAPDAVSSTDVGQSYELIRRRLLEHARELARRAEALNQRRQAEFGTVSMEVLGQGRVRTENNCIPADMVGVGRQLLLGFNVTMGLKKETRVADVFALYEMREGEDGYVFDEVGLSGTFLDDARFVREFAELYQYYKAARLHALRIVDGRLLAIFRVGDGVRDVKVLRWGLDPAGNATYMDNRGERDNVFPATHDFEWTRTSREDHVLGRHPHVNILDELFVETVGGDLTVKVEDNTEDGEGIYSEPVDDRNQSLDDAEIEYAALGSLILLRVLPYRETVRRHLVFNRRTRTVMRLDAIGQSCVQLPEDHGIVFPGGHYLRTGEYKLFDGAESDLVFKRRIRAPNGEDVLFVFHRHRDGMYVLLPYNVIRKEVANPLTAHGYSRFADGRIVVFRASTEATRVHPMQVWRTPFMSDEHAAAQPVGAGPLARVGNPDLVRGISDALTLRTLAQTDPATAQTWEALVQSCVRMRDAYHWLGDPALENLGEAVEHVRAAGELIVGEFEKVRALRRRASEELRKAEADTRKLLEGLRPGDLREVTPFLEAMTALRRQRGHLITLQEVRFIDRPALDALEARVIRGFDDVSRACVQFLLGPEALAPVVARLGALEARMVAVDRSVELAVPREELDTLGKGLDLLTEVVSGLEVDDPTLRTRILDALGEVFGAQNRVRATLVARDKDLRTHESRSEFAAQVKLYAQSMSQALARAQTPADCDAELSRLFLQLEQLEARFGELDEFLPELATRREDTWAALDGKKQTLQEQRQRRVQNLHGAAVRILDGVARRGQSFVDEDALQSFFAGDPMVLKLRGLAEQLTELDDGVKAQEVLGRLQAARQDALRGLRDKQDLYGDGGTTVQLGRHKFSVNTQPVELAIVPHGGGMAIHLTATDYHESLDDEEFLATQPYWSQLLVSETAEVYRGEYLASCMVRAAEGGTDGLSEELLKEAALKEGGLLTLVRSFASARHEEAYERGVHDVDAARILDVLLSLRQGAGLLAFPPRCRAAAALTWLVHPQRDRVEALARQARSLGRLRGALRAGAGLRVLAATLAVEVERATADLAGFTVAGADADLAGRYLAEVLTSEHVVFTVGGESASLRDALRRELDSHAIRSAFDADLRGLEELPAGRLAVARAWIDAVAAGRPEPSEARLEAAVLMAFERQLEVTVSSARTRGRVEGLLGQHPHIVERRLDVVLDAFLVRLEQHHQVVVPGYRAYQALRHRRVEEGRRRLRVGELVPKVLSSFVRNRLIDEVYLPLVGDNMAKQMGAMGTGKRTDLMGMLLLVSPPGYGKTTLMEYVASRMGLVFVKVNGPALGHEVRSLDPSEAPNATARQEVERINLAFEMANNVMLYLDDIQHTHPELLQKFISLCDGQRRIEGVWRGRTRTYDLRGKRFCVVMAGNPYTESGDKFVIPDMLANRADTYNLGDILSGREHLFALSYVENSLTSNATLAPIASRAPADLHKLVRMAEGEEIPTTDLKADWTAVEVTDMVEVLKKLFACRDVLMKVNAEYIRSAAQEDAYRTEPPFKLQGSYRNMNKLAEKIVPAMNAAELQAWIGDHYIGESQTLTTGAEQNLLKLGELRGTLSASQAARWDQIKKDYARVKLLSGGEDDPVARVTATLTGLNSQLERIGEAVGAASLTSGGALAALQESVEGLRGGLREGLQVDRVGPPLASLVEELRASRESAERGDGAVAEQVARLGRTLAPTAVAQALTSVEGQLQQVGATLGEVLERPATPRLPPELGEGLEDLVKKVDTVARVIHNGNPRGLHERLQAIEGHLDGLVDTLGRLAERPVGVSGGAGAAPPPKAAAPHPPAFHQPGLRSVVPSPGVADPADRTLHDARREMLEALQSALAGVEAPSTDEARLALGAAVPVLHGLGTRLSDLVARGVPTRQRDVVLDEMRRFVADALTELARLDSRKG